MYQVYRRVCKAVATHVTNEFIKFPAGAKAEEVMKTFERKKSIAGILGAIDGTHMPIKCPKSHSDQFINRKGFSFRAVASNLRS